MLNSFCLQIKRCGEMARKLRLFKEQMTKAGIVPSAMPATQTQVDFDDLEVCLMLSKRLFSDSVSLGLV